MSDPIDIVERLRTDVLWHQRRGNDTIARDCQEAAAEIEQLRADLATSMETLAKAQALQAEMLKERAALAQPAAPGWQPIETAPKDVAILVHCTHGMYVAEWRDIDIAYWHVDDNKHGPFPLRGTSPTHWMPLPAAPQAPQPGGRGA